MTSVGQQQKPTGRPRDPEIRDKVLLAAQRVYVRGGFGGLTFEAVARESGVGKPAIYRRWANAAQLMDDVVSSHVLVPPSSEHGSVRLVLRAIAMSSLRLSHSEEGSFVLRLSSERSLQPELLGKYLERIRNVVHVQNRSLLEQAIDRGELAKECDPDILIQTITGAVLVSALLGFTVPPHDDEQAAERFCDRLVDQVLNGVLA